MEKEKKNWEPMDCIGKEGDVGFLFLFLNLKGFGGKMERTIRKGMLADYKKGIEEFSSEWSK